MIKEYIWEYQGFLMPYPIIIRAKTREELQDKVMSFIKRDGGYFVDLDSAKITEVYDDRIQDMRNSLKQFSDEHKGVN